MPITKNCDHCGIEYTRPPAKEGRFCSRKCSALFYRKEIVSVRRMLYAPQHPLADKNGYAPEHRVLVYDHIGEGQHRCHWCKKLVTWIYGAGRGAGTSRSMLVVDHVDGNHLNNDLSNLVPSCQLCNSSRARSLPDGELSILDSHSGRRRRAQKCNCEKCGKEFLAALSQLKDGRGRFCSRSCARSAVRKPKT